MCISFPIRPGDEPGPLTRAWRRVGGSPQRLLGLLGAVYAVVLAVLALSGLVAGPVLGFALVYGAVGLPLVGVLLERMPVWANRLPVHYVWYGGAYWAGAVALVLLAVAALWGAPWRWAGGAFLLLAWLLALHPLHHMRPWVGPESAAKARAAVFTVYAVTASLPVAGFFAL